ncbi:MAG TPA: tetratricopeptide repeat protein [Caulobacteraceae bacterium]|jgi:tetratricopeptide (TPR) repeat protein
MNAPERPLGRLESWKAVAAYFGRDERTVRRWEAERGLPIRRLPGGGRSRIFADVSEIEAWRRGGGADEAAKPPRTPRFLKRWLYLGVVAAATAAAIVIGVLWLGLGFKARLGPPPIAAQRLYVEGEEAWAQRSPASLNQALDDFNAATRIDPDYAEAWVGLAKTYDLIREYTLVPEAQAFQLARAAAQRALKLDNRLAGAHTALAFADYWGYWDAAAARREFQRGIELDPKSSLAHHWYATFLPSQGDFAGALREIARARKLDPNSRAIRADQGELLIQAGRVDEALTDLRAAEAADPGFRSPHTYLANYYFLHGPEAEYVRECDTLADVIHDASGKAECDVARRGLATGGRRGMLEALLASRLEQLRVGGATACSVAGLYNLLGDKAQALALLRQGLSRHEGDMLGLRADGRFVSLRGDPEFQAIVREMKPL